MARGQLNLTQKRNKMKETKRKTTTAYRKVESRLDQRSNEMIVNLKEVVVRIKALIYFLRPPLFSGRELNGETNAGEALK